MNYGRVANAIALGLMTVCSVLVVIGLVSLWLNGPVTAAVMATLLAVPTGAMVLLRELEDRHS